MSPFPKFINLESDSIIPLLASLTGSQLADNVVSDNNQPDSEPAVPKPKFKVITAEDIAHLDVPKEKMAEW